MPDIQPNKGVTKPETAAKQIEEKTAEFLEVGRSIPFFGQIDIACLYSANLGEAAYFRRSSDLLVGAQVAHWLSVVYPELTGDGLEDEEAEEVSYEEEEPETVAVTGGFESNKIYLVGFEVSAFAKLAAAEAAEVGEKTFPAALWSSGGYREVDSLLRPGSKAKKLPQELAFRRLGLDYDPGLPRCVDAYKDCRLAIEALHSLNLVPPLRHKILEGLTAIDKARPQKIKKSA